MPASGVTPVQVLRGFRSHCAGALARYQPTHALSNTDVRANRYYGTIWLCGTNAPGTDVGRVAISFEEEWPQDKAVAVRTGSLVASAQGSWFPVERPVFRVQGWREANVARS
eukprot:596229-Rhodomonas_salina.3